MFTNRFILLLCCGVFALNISSQSKLQRAGRASKVGTSSTTSPNASSVKPSATKKPSVTTGQVKHTTSNSSKYALTGYMDILGISFANADANKTIIDNYDCKLYAQEVKYLTPKISYRGLANEEITLNVKIIDEDGTVKSGSGSPDGYTYSKNVKVEVGPGKEIKLPGWGTSLGGSYKAGLYKIEVWYKNNLLYQKDFRLYSGATPVVSSNIFTIDNVFFANEDSNGQIISDFGQTLVDGKVQYLTPKIYYKGKYVNNQDVTLYFKYFKSSGELISGSSSPLGFSFKEVVTIKPGSNSVTTSGYGNESATNFKEGECKVEIWMDGEKLYETNVTISKPGESGYVSGSNVMNLNAMLERPMMIGNCNPITSSYISVKNSLSPIYTLDEKTDKSKRSFYIWPRLNDSVRSLTYCGVPFDHFYFMVENDTNSSLQRRISYDFEINKDRMESSKNPYQYLDQMISDFNGAGINLSYERKNEKYLKAKGKYRMGNVQYDISLDEYTTCWHYSIDIWVWK